VRRATAFRTGPSDSATLRGLSPLCHRRSSASPDRDVGARRRSRPRIPRGDRRPTGAACRPTHDDRSCRYARHPALLQPLRSNQAHHRVRDRRADRHRMLQRNHETESSRGGQTPREEYRFALHPSGSSLWRHIISANHLLSIAKSPRTRSNFTRPSGECGLRRSTVDFVAIVVQQRDDRFKDWISDVPLERRVDFVPIHPHR